MNYIYLLYLLLVSVASQIIKLIKTPNNIVAINGTTLNKIINIVKRTRNDHIVKQIIYFFKENFKENRKWLYY